MCKVINFNEYRGNKDAKGEAGKVRQVKKGVEKRILADYQRKH